MFNVLPNDMPIDSQTKKPRRNIIGFEPCGPIAEMIHNELRSGINKTDLMETCVAKALGSKYPKLAERFRIIREEAA